MNTQPKTHNLPPASPRRRRVVLFILTMVLIVGGIVEVGARVWLVFAKSLPAGRPDAIVLAYYPEMHPAWMTPIDRDDGYFDVLILAGSVLYDYYGAPAALLRYDLAARGVRGVRVWNMARPAHGTRDSLIKYRWLREKRFDWVVVYHGINELRANNVPEAAFREDYSHLAWYGEVNTMLGSPRAGVSKWLGTPVLWDYLRVVACRAMGPRPMVELNLPPSDEAMVFGADIKTRTSFEKNLREIGRIARERGEWLTYVTFASWLDPDYTHDALIADRELVPEGGIGDGRKLSYDNPVYADFAQPCEIWGRPAHLVAGVRAHNEATRRVAGMFSMVADLLDFANKVPHEGVSFIDFCHLAPTGVARLAHELADHAMVARDAERVNKTGHP